MNDKTAVLRRKLTELRDNALPFLSELAEDYGPQPGIIIPRSPVSSFWNDLPPEVYTRSDNLRRQVRQVMVQVATAARRSPLLTDVDVGDLTANAKRIAAAVRLRKYIRWGVTIQHDEDIVLGVDPAGQSEAEWISPQDAHTIFSEACNDSVEMMDFIVQGEDRRLISGGADVHSVMSYRRDTAFVMMWISRKHPELDDVRDTVKEVFKAFSITAVRADEIEHESVITKRILEEIETSEFLFADLTGERPSVYYEVGYAHALGKTVMLYRKKGTEIHFDLAHRNCPEYENLGDLRAKLTKRLTEVTNKRI